MFEKKSTAEKIKVMQAYLNGETLEVTADGFSSWVEWGFRGEPEWNWEGCDYRVKEEDYTLDIPWEVIEDKWKWAAMDGDGEAYLYTGTPSTGPEQWLCEENVMAKGVTFLKINLPPTKHWNKTLTKRPEGV